MNTRPKVNKDLQTLKEDAAKVLQDIAKINQEIMARGEDTLDDYSSSVQKKLDIELESLKDRLGTIEKSLAKQVKAIDKSVKTNPYAYIAGAAGLGLLLGKLTSRRES